MARLSGEGLRSPLMNSLADRNAEKDAMRP